VTQGNRAQADLEDGGLSGLEALRRIHAGQSAQPPIHYWSGRRLASLQHGEASISIPASGWFCDPKGRLHSGIFAFLLDMTHVDAAHRHSLHDGRAFRNGPRRTSCQRRGDHRVQPGHLYSDERNALAEGLVVDQAGHLVAHSMSRYFLSASGAVIPPRPGSEPLPRTRSPAAEQETMTAREKLTVPPENSAAWKKTIPEVPAPGLSLPSCSATVSNRSLKVRVRCSASVLSACSLCAFSVFSSCSPRRSGLERSLRAGPLEVRRTAPSAHASERTGPWLCQSDSICAAQHTGRICLRSQYAPAPPGLIPAWVRFRAGPARAPVRRRYFWARHPEVGGGSVHHVLAVSSRVNPSRLRPRGAPHARWVRREPARKRPAPTRGTGPRRAAHPVTCPERD